MVSIVVNLPVYLNETCNALYGRVNGGFSKIFIGNLF